MIELNDLLILFKDSAESGAAKAIGSGVSLVNRITKAEAYRLYGRSIVERWIAEKLITPIHSPATNFSKWFDRAKLEAVAASSNRLSYLPVAER